jgi:hypothetical protein
MSGHPGRHIWRPPGSSLRVTIPANVSIARSA